MNVEKTPCPTCGRAMKPRHTKGTDFMPRHQAPNGTWCSGVGAVVNAKPRCEDCGTDSCHKLSDPAPTVEASDAEESSMSETAPGFVAGPPAPAEVSHWQQQAREAAARHIDTLVSGEPNGDAAQDAVDRLKHEAAEALVKSLNPDAFMDPAPLGGSVTVATGAFSPDAFMDPATDGGEEPELNVSGQPKARYEWWGEQNRGYLVKLPETGDFRRYKNGNPKGITRATTFNKAASDRTALSAWGKRNVVVGATLRRDILLRAHGLDKEDPAGKRALDGIVADLEAAAGAKIGADVGTFLHGITERLDAGVATPEDAPEEFREQLRLYQATLKRYGLEPVPGLIERTVYLDSFGGVVGTFDRIAYDRPNNRYVILDVKTGATMDHARDETFCQEWIYARAVNRHGVYDWNTDTWDDVMGKQCLTVSETVGVIVHMPVKGKLAGQVILEMADLVKGAAYARLCHDVRSNEKPKQVLWPEPPAEPVQAPEEPEPRFKRGSWQARFRAVTSREEANALYKEAKATGLGSDALALLVPVGKEALARLAKQDGDR